MLELTTCFRACMYRLVYRILEAFFFQKTHTHHPNRTHPFLSPISSWVVWYWNLDIDIAQCNLHSVLNTSLPKNQRFVYYIITLLALKDITSVILTTDYFIKKAIDTYVCLCSYFYNQWRQTFPSCTLIYNNKLSNIIFFYLYLQSSPYFNTIVIFILYLKSLYCPNYNIYFPSSLLNFNESL